MCRPISFFWKGWDGSEGKQEDHCININIETYTYAGINMALDILILLLPIPQVFPYSLVFGCSQLTGTTQVLDLQMNLRKKLGVVFIFTIGAL